MSLASICPRYFCLLATTYTFKIKANVNSQYYYKIHVQVHKSDAYTTPFFFFTADGDFLIYEFKAPISCVKIEEAQTITVTFKNAKGQIKNGSVDVPVIYSKLSLVNRSFFQSI